MIDAVFILKKGDQVFSRFFDTVEEAHRFARAEELPEPVSQWTLRLLKAGELRA